MNISDGELMQGVLTACGFELAARPDDANVILVNTCAIREHAEQRVIGRVGELYRFKRDRPDTVIGVTGCMAQRMGTALLERAPYVDFVMGPDGYRGLPDVLARLRPWAGRAAVSTRVARDGVGAGEAAVAAVLTQDADAHGGPSQDAPGPPFTAQATPRRSLPVLATGAAAVAGEEAEAASSPANERLAVLEFAPGENYEGLEVRRSSRVSAWVPVQRGCDYRCTYCIVPYVRGAEKNRDPERVLDEVRATAAAGITEVVLLGQTVNSWRHGAWSFARLMRAVARTDGIRRVRFTSPHPNDVTPELVAVMAEEPAVCRQLHLPVQSGHDRTLRRMLRRYTVAEYLQKVRMVRAAMPDIALSTDIIVAFPGETDAEYQATLELVREVRYDDAFLYKYSAREGTPATRLPRADFIPAALAQERLERLIELHRSIQAEINHAEVGRSIEVLVERAGKTPGDVMGRTESYKTATFPGDASLINRYLTVRLTGTTGATFRAVRVEPTGEHRVA